MLTIKVCGRRRTLIVKHNGVAGIVKGKKMQWTAVECKGNEHNGRHIQVMHFDSMTADIIFVCSGWRHTCAQCWSPHLALHLQELQHVTHFCSSIMSAMSDGDHSAPARLRYGMQHAQYCYSR